MGRVSGDKSRFNKKRRQKLARRVEMRALAKTMAANTPKPAAPEGSLVADLTDSRSAVDRSDSR